MGKFSSADAGDLHRGDRFLLGKSVQQKENRNPRKWDRRKECKRKKGSCKKVFCARGEKPSYIETYI